MPQMSPLNWLQIFFYFQILYTFMVILHYYMFMYKTSNNSYQKKNKNISWKW